MSRACRFSLLSFYVLSLSALRPQSGFSREEAQIHIRVFTKNVRNMAGFLERGFILTKVCVCGGGGGGGRGVRVADFISFNIP